MAGFERAVAAGEYLVGVRTYGLVFVGVLGGIVAVAAGLREAVAVPGRELGGATALYMGGGAALFLVSDQISRSHMSLGISRSRLAIAATAAATTAVGTSVSGAHRRRRWPRCWAPGSCSRVAGPSHSALGTAQASDGSEASAPR